MEFFLICFFVIGSALYLGYKKNKKKHNSIKRANTQKDDRKAFNQKYARQFRALGRKKNKDPKEFRKLYSKMAREKKEKNYK
tara:strand:- start:52 stop:297 length:246 start_codon:yes stop_codon:yes gene_type:complete